MGFEYLLYCFELTSHFYLHTHTHNKVILVLSTSPPRATIKVQGSINIKYRIGESNVA